MLIGKMRTCTETKDWPGLEQSAHRLKGNLRNFFAEDLAHKAGLIEAAAHNRESQFYETQIDSLETDLRQFETELQSFLQTFH